MHSLDMLKAVVRRLVLPNYCCHGSCQHPDINYHCLFTFFGCKAQQIDRKIIYLPVT